MGGVVVVGDEGVIPHGPDVDLDGELCVIVI